MTISSATNPMHAMMARRTQAANVPAQQSDEAMIRQRFAGMLGLNPDQLASPKASGDGSKASPALRQNSASLVRQVPDSRTAGSTTTVAPQAAAVTTLVPVVTSTPPTVDEPGPTITAGTMFNGMVSAGPMSPGLSSMTGIPTSTGTHLIAVASDAQKFNYDPIAMIKDRLAKLGVSPDSVKLERWVDTINGPGGQRVNQYVRGTINGVAENFAVERVLQNPDITAVEIQSLMSRSTQSV